MTKKQRSSSINIPHYTLVIPATPSSFPLHPRHSRYTLVIPATPSSFPRRRESIGLGTPQIKTWIPACAGMTVVIGMTVGVGDGGMAGWRVGQVGMRLCSLAGRDSSFSLLNSEDRRIGREWRRVSVQV